MPVERTRYGTWRARWTDPWGRQVAKSHKTKALADAHYRKVLGDMARGDYVDPRLGRITLERWADEWLAGARNLSRGGYDTYRRDLDRHILPALGEVPVGRLSGADIDRYLTSIGGGVSTRDLLTGVDHHSTGLSREPVSTRNLLSPPTRTLAPSTVHRHYRTLHRMLAVAVKRGLIPRNPCEHIEPPKVPRTERTALTIAQVDDLADTIADRYRAWVYVMAYGGLRWSESVGLRRGRVQNAALAPADEARLSAVHDRRISFGCCGREDGFAQEIAAGFGSCSEKCGKRGRLPPMDTRQPVRLQIVEQLIHRGPGEWERTQPKTGKGRVVTLPGFAADELAIHLERYSLPGPDGLVFPTRNGTPVQSPSFTANVFKRALRKAGLPDVRIHDLRHTAVSLAIDAGANVKVSQARAGHASASLHLDTYGHRYEAADVAVAERLDVLRAESQRRRLRAV